MSTFNLMRIYLTMHNAPRLPYIGYAGILYNSPLIDRGRAAFREEASRATHYPEFKGTNLIMGKGSMGQYGHRRFYSTTVDDIKKVEKEREKKNKFKLHTPETMKVILVSESGSVTGVSLEEANKIAKKKGLELTKIENMQEKPIKTERDVYRLVSVARSLADETSSEDIHSVLEDEKPSPGSSKQMELKTVILKSNIGENDAQSKLNQMKKWITKGYRIRVSVGQAGDKGNAESVFKQIETTMAEVGGQIQQKVKKSNQIRFYVGPPKNKPTADIDTDTDPSSKQKKRNKGLKSDGNEIEGDGDNEVDKKAREQS